jgi:uncharacterized FAD-dependent dehydrogenase
MLRLNEIRLSLDHADEAEHRLREAAAQRLGIPAAALRSIRVARRGYDARKRSQIMLVYTLDVELQEAAQEAAILLTQAGAQVQATPDTTYRFVARAVAGSDERPVVVGMGPCGLFAALLLAQMGFRPILLERGQAVRQRTQDTWGLWRKQVLNPESNVQFGEGGAGTFSDGKLYSQIKDRRHLGRKVLEEFVKAGAPEEILYLSKPHIGTFKLVGMVERMRAEIIALGGEVRFGQRVEELLLDAAAADEGRGRQVRGLRLADGSILAARHVVLAIGHSARDTFAHLQRQGVHLEAKPFSIGVRIEHPQSLIDRVRFGRFAGHPLLGAADYKLVHHGRQGRSAYSFCMCPGGTVVAATSEAGCVVTNGMSQYSRNERNANSALVVDVRPDDFVAYARSPDDALAGIEFQRYWEGRAFEVGGSNYCAPVQRVGDFLAGRPSTALGEVLPSYTPGVRPADLAECLPDYVVATLREALPAFDRQLRGYALDDALLTGIETRTSSPLCIRRGVDFQSINTPGLYPAGEGAGYAGGILSAAIDGIEVAEAVALSLAQAAPGPQ